MLRTKVSCPGLGFIQTPVLVSFFFSCVYLYFWCVVSEAAKKAFDAKVKEHDDFVAKMKKEIDQAEKCAKEKKTLEKNLLHYKEAMKVKEATITKLEFDLAKLSELHTK